MFWNKFIELCEMNNIKPNPLGKELGVSSESLTKWKNGAIPGAETLVKIADRFDVSVDYLLDRTEQKNASMNNGSVINSGSNNNIQNGNNIINSNNNNIAQSAPIENDDVLAKYSKLSKRNKLKVQVDILNRGHK